MSEHLFRVEQRVVWNDSTDAIIREKAMTYGPGPFVVIAIESVPLFYRKEVGSSQWLTVKNSNGKDLGKFSGLFFKPG